MAVKYSTRKGIGKMRKETERNLFNELKRHAYSTVGEYDLDRLFDVYTSTEIQKFEDLFETSIQKDFKDFLVENIELMRGLERDENGRVTAGKIKTIRSLACKKTFPLQMLTHYIYNELKEEQESYVELVEHIIGKQKTNLLDVGSGQVPYSSFLLAKDNVGTIHSMDKFGISKESIKRLGVLPHDEYFYSTMPIKNYDIIVGNKPCSAIPHIVSACVKNKKPYLIKLCPCEAPGYKIEGWKEYLPILDEKIKFDEDDYAFNLDL